MKILNIIVGLNDGGAEGVLYRLCLYDKNYKHIVISLMDEGKYGPLLKEVGIEVHCLNMPAGRFTFTGLYKLFKLIRKSKPNIVQTWMYHADLIGGVVARLAGVKNVFWNIRHTTLEPGKSKRSTIFIAKLCAMLSKRVPIGIVCCAEKALEVHTSIGYDTSKMTVIANGYDPSILCAIPNSQAQLNKELGDVFPAIGMVARFDPEKEHFDLLEAFLIVKKKGLPHKLVLVGYKINTSNIALIEKIESLKLKNEVLLLDQRRDIPTIMSSLDLHVLSSSSEAFPNVLAEAMACNTPCVTTDVGEAAHIVGDTGWVVRPKNPQALADAILTALNEIQSDPSTWVSRKVACRKRIVDNFSIETMVGKYHQVWTNK
ncbi:glycosyltransferase [Candidatus Pelagibacter ubique]|nr:glycosyltransferase [Candidatus Pelagibacter ubique]